MTIPRREFIGFAGATGLLAAAGPLAGLEPASRFLTDEEKVAAGNTLTGITSTAAGGAESILPNYDMTWVDRITGKHRAVFDSPAFSDGAALFRAVMWCNQYKQVMQTPRTDMSPVVIFRHEGIVLAVNNQYWDEYDLGKEYKLKGEDGKVVKKNPVNGPAAGEKGGSPYSVPAFIASGGIILACGLAFSGIVASVAKKRKIERAEAQKVAEAEYLLPGVILMPSGVFAAIRAQEAGCHYMVGS